MTPSTPDREGTREAELERMIAKLPQRIALCPDPDCAAEFYYPLNDGEGLKCPTPNCSHQMIVYEKQAP